jgi:hypothetical protein
MAELLLCGQVDDAAAPVAAAAKLYVFSSSYGQSAGTDVPGLIEAMAIAPAGKSGRVLVRQITVVIGYDNTCTTKITPIIDLITELDPVTEQFTAPSSFTTHPITVPVARTCTYIGVRIECVARAGRWEPYTPEVAGKILTGAHPAAVGATA